MRVKTLLAAAAMALVVTPASALTINLNDVGGVTGSPAERGFRAAAAFWESVLADDITVNLNVGFGPLGPNILGSTGSTLFRTSATNIYATLGFDATSALDASAVSTLQPLSGLGGITATVPGYTNAATQQGLDVRLSRVDGDNSFNNIQIIGTSADLKALGFILPANTVDGSITFSSNFAFDFDPRDGISAGQSDFIAVAIHEIGHALGFVSGVDRYDANSCPNGPGCATFGTTGRPDNSAFADVLDLFRYSAPGTLDFRPGDATYFSIDGGQSQLFGNSQFSTGQFNGDGFQASHFKSNGTCFNFIGILNPFICSGVAGAATASDLAVFDAIGYDVNVDVLANRGFTFTSAQAFNLVPEPATWVGMILGFGAIGGAVRRRATMRLARA